MNISIDDLEAAAALGWRAPEEARLGSWLLRAAEGFTGRANSALAIGDPGLPLAAAIGRVCSWYQGRGLPAAITVAFPAGGPAGPLNDLLDDRRWQLRSAPAVVMTAEAAIVAAASRVRAADRPRAAAGRAAVRVDLAAEPDACWLAAYHPRGQELPPVAGRLLMSAPWQAFGSVRAAGQTIAIGRVAVAAGWAGLTAIEVHPAHRRRGLGTAITGALAASAADRGVSGIYLQVERANAAARTLYGRLGFADHHAYHHRLAIS